MAYNKLHPNSKNRVAIYVRVSTLHQIDKDSLPMQKQDLIAYAKLILNTDDVVIFEDAGYSGKNTVRPKYQEMMSQIRAGLFTHLLVWKIDRISRNLLDFATMYTELKNLGVVFVSKHEQFDTSSAMGEAMLKIILVFAELERNITSERVTSTMISRASNGLWNGGRIPFGYDYDAKTQEFSIIPEEGALVRLIHDKYEEMLSIVRLARWLNDQGYRTRVGNEWSAITVHLVLRTVFNCGDYRYNVLKEGDRQKVKDESEWITVENHHPAIVSREQKERVIATLASRQRMKRKNRATKYVHIFSELLVCGNCGSPMGATPASAKKDWSYSKYPCYRNRKVSTPYGCKTTSDPIVGEFVFNYILNMLNLQADFDNNINTPEELQSRLLFGDTFKDISHIQEDGLNDLFNVLSSGKVRGSIYGKGASLKTKKNQQKSELTKYRQEKLKLERALDRLTNLYLYSDESMSETEFIIQKAKLIEQLDDINERIGLINNDDWHQSVSDEEFIERASEFIIAQKFAGRNYINFKKLYTSVELSVLQSFLRTVIDSIIMDTGRVKQIVFKNGLSHTFIYKDQQENPGT